MTLLVQWQDGREETIAVADGATVHIGFGGATCESWLHAEKGVLRVVIHGDDEPELTLSETSPRAST